MTATLTHQVQACLRCGGDGGGIFRRGLCDRCYDHQRYHNLLGGWPLLRRPYHSAAAGGPDVHCPDCRTTGLVVGYEAGPDGRPISYICLARAHGNVGHRFTRERVPA